MIQLFKMAYRDLGRNRRRSFLSALAVGIGMALLLLMAAVVSGEMHTSMESSIKLQTGHVQVRTNAYEEGKSSLAWEDLIEAPEKMAAQIAALPVVKVATPRLLASGIVTAGDQSLGVVITGVDPASPANQPIVEGLLSGSFPAADDRDGILIGQPLANKLGLKTGDTLKLLANTSNGDVDEQVFTVRGIYTTRNPGFDESSVYLPLSKAQAITQTENHASIIFILLNDRDQAGAVAAALQTAQYQVKTWLQMNDMLVQFENFSGAYMVVLYLIVLGITATVIVNTLIMSVYERTREIGILAAIGMKSSRIMAMFFAESSLLGVGGIGLGLILGGLLVAYATIFGFYIGDYGVTNMLIGETIYAHLTVSDAVGLTLITFIITMLAGLYPAILAARLEPVEALRGGK